MLKETDGIFYEFIKQLFLFCNKSPADVRQGRRKGRFCSQTSPALLRNYTNATNSSTRMTSLTRSQRNDLLFFSELSLTPLIDPLAALCCRIFQCPFENLLIFKMSFFISFVPEFTPNSDYAFAHNYFQCRIKAQTNLKARFEISQSNKIYLFINIAKTDISR